MNYYNENNPACAHWLRELIAQKLIPPGHVDQRSIVNVTGTDLAGFTQCHFFAGIAGWSLALRLAGWPDDKPVWTGSCPCQPFSCAGQGRGTADPRHLWPQFFRLIGECKPSTIFGEQVASAAGRIWLSGVRADLETLAYAVGGADLCAAGVGAPQIRQRLWWVAQSNGRDTSAAREQRGGKQRLIETNGGAGRLAQSDQGERGRLANGQGRERHGAEIGREQSDGEPQPCGITGGLADAKHSERRPELQEHTNTHGRNGLRGGSHAGAWSNFDATPCSDGKARRVESGTFPLAHGVSGRVGLLRGYGNAITPQLAAEFIQACEEAREALI